MIGKIRKMLKEKAGVSPIIAIILMVAITVVLAATIYVWVSGFGGSGSSTPAISCSPDNVNDKLVVSSCDTGINWTDISIKVTSGATVNISCSAGTIHGTGTSAINSNGAFVSIGDDTKVAVPSGSLLMHAGDEITVESGSGAVSITLRYDTNDSIIGTWTVYV